MVLLVQRHFFSLKKYLFVFISVNKNPSVGLITFVSGLGKAWGENIPNNLLLSFVEKSIIKFGLQAIALMKSLSPFKP